VKDQKTTMILALALLLTGLLFTGQIQAQDYYKWTDDRGVTHYGSQPPKQFINNAIRVRVDASTPSGADVAQSKINARTEQLENKTESSNTAKEEAEKKQNEANLENCAIYKKNLLLMTQNNRIRGKNAEGEVIILSAEAKKTKMQAAESYIAEYCK